MGEIETFGVSLCNRHASRASAAAEINGPYCTWGVVNLKTAGAAQASPAAAHTPDRWPTPSGLLAWSTQTSPFSMSACPTATAWKPAAQSARNAQIWALSS